MKHLDLEGNTTDNSRERKRVSSKTLNVTDSVSVLNELFNSFADIYSGKNKI